MRAIHSLEDLRAAKQELAVKRQRTKQEFRKQLYVVQRETGSYLLKRVLLPLGLGVGAFFAYRYFSDKGKKPEKGTHTTQKEAIEDLNADQHKISWVSYLSLLFSVIKIVQQFRANTGQSTSEQEAAPAKEQDEMPEDNAFSPKEFVAGYRRRAAAAAMENE